ncbi:MAG: hypothetical protein PHC45_06300 [Clostridiaceae bacterium]|nr:hypothetical protein [Clostridiaceae bacterium]
MSEKKFNEALKLILEESEFTAFIKATSEVSRAKEEEEKKNPIPEGETADEVMEKYLDGLEIVETISKGGFYGGNR